MSDFPSLAQVLAEHRWWAHLSCCACTLADPHAKMTIEEHEHHLDTMWREACEIRTVEELDALPVLATIKEILPPAPSGNNYGAIWEKWNGPQWKRMGYGTERGQDYSGPVHLPALLIWHPGWGQS